MITATDAAETLQINWGTVPDWIAAIGSVLAFGIAAAGYVWSVALSRNAQARKVSTATTLIDTYDRGDEIKDFSPGVYHVGTWHPPGQKALIALDKTAVVRFKIVNNSDEVMGPVTIEVAEAGATEFLPGVSYEFSRVQPGDSESGLIALQDRWHPAHPDLRVRIVFRDSSGRWWQRLENEAVRRAPRHRNLRMHEADQAKLLAQKSATPRSTEVPEDGELEWRLDPTDPTGKRRIARHKGDPD